MIMNFRFRISIKYTWHTSIHIARTTACGLSGLMNFAFIMHILNIILFAEQQPEEKKNWILMECFFL